LYHARLPSQAGDVNIAEVLVNETELDEISDIAPDYAANDFEIDQVFKHVTYDQRKDLDQLLCSFSEVFSDKPGRTKLCTHRIELEKNVKPIRCTPYRLGPEKTKFLKEELDTLLKLGIITESESGWGLQWC
jgi:hypothetical protein